MLPNRSFFKYDGHGPVLFVCLAYLVLTISVQTQTMGSSGAPCPWEQCFILLWGHQTEGLNHQGWMSPLLQGHGCYYLEPGNVCISSSCCSVHLIGLNGCRNQSLSICAHRQGKGTNFSASLQTLQTRSSSWSGTKDERPGNGWCWLVDWVGEELPIVCYTMPKPQLRPWAATSRRF